MFLIVSLLANNQEISQAQVVLPEPFAMVTDDLGWVEGSSQGLENGPWRIGFRHRMDEQDYTPFVVIGEALGIRLQGAFILAEMDRLNVCAQYPTTTREKENWDNSDKISIHQIRSMDYVVKIQPILNLRSMA